MLALIWLPRATVDVLSSWFGALITGVSRVYTSREEKLTFAPAGFGQLASMWKIEFHPVVVLTSFTRWQTGMALLN